VATWREVGGGKQFAQAQVAAAILHQQQQARRAFLLVGSIVVADPDVAADNGLDSLATRRGVELDHAEQIGQIGDRQRRLAIRHRLRDGLVDARQAIRDRIFAVKAEMNECWLGRRGGHGSAILLPPPRGTPPVFASAHFMPWLYWRRGFPP
jgi:hypothetical protein